MIIINYLLLLLILLFNKSNCISLKQSGIGKAYLPNKSIRPNLCKDDKGNEGICMFALACRQSNGISLGICKDSIYAGSCCQLPKIHDLNEKDIGTYSSNNINKLASILKKQPTESTMIPSFSPSSPLPLLSSTSSTSMLSSLSPSLTSPTVMNSTQLLVKIITSCNNLINLNSSESFNYKNITKTILPNIINKPVDEVYLSNNDNESSMEIKYINKIYSNINQQSNLQSNNNNTLQEIYPLLVNDTSFSSKISINEMISNNLNLNKSSFSNKIIDDNTKNESIVSKLSEDINDELMIANSKHEQTETILNHIDVTQSNDISDDLFQTNNEFNFNQKFDEYLRNETFSLGIEFNDTTSNKTDYDNVNQMTSPTIFDLPVINSSADSDINENITKTIFISDTTEITSNYNSDFLIHNQINHRYNSSFINESIYDSTYLITSNVSHKLSTNKPNIQINLANTTLVDLSNPVKSSSLSTIDKTSTPSSIITINTSSNILDFSSTNFDNISSPIFSNSTTNILLTTQTSNTPIISNDTFSTTQSPLFTSEFTSDKKPFINRPYDNKLDCGIRPLKSRARVVGGRNAQFGEWPWLVLVKEATWLGLFVKTKCGGVLIHRKWVLTAAHCQPGFWGSLIVIVGEYDLTADKENLKPVAKPVKRMIVHRDYNAATFDNDIALLELESPLDIQPHVVPICLPKQGELFSGQMATVAGWGGPIPSILQVVKLPIIRNSRCQEMYDKAGHKKEIKSTFVCAGYSTGGKDSCEGDSGGPLMVQRPDKHWILVGTVSHGIKCAEPNLPGVYMRTSSFGPWIDSIINKRFHKHP